MLFQSNNIYLLWTWHNPIANCDNSGICLRISSVTRCTPRCCGLKFIFFWNHAELVWIILAEEAMFDLLSLSVASLNVYLVIQKQLSVKLYTTETLLPLKKIHYYHEQIICDYIKSSSSNIKKCGFYTAVSAILTLGSFRQYSFFFRPGAESQQKGGLFEYYFWEMYPHFTNTLDI